MDEFTKILYIGAGGAAGAVARHLINISPVNGWFGKFPTATFLINISGSFLIGFLLILLTDRVQISPNLRVAIIVGFIGAFTTFSTFEIEILELFRERLIAVAIVYALLSVVGGLLGAAAGVLLARRF